MSFLFGARNLMALKKELCEKCWGRISGGGFEIDEKYWEEGKTYCPSKYAEKKYTERNIKEQPPERCPFILEHTV